MAHFLCHLGCSHFGALLLDFHFTENSVLEEYHRKGIGKELFNRAKKAAKEMGYSFIQAKTVQMGKYKSYDDTNRFYLSIGFKEFEVFPTLWDEWNPCQIYVMGI